MVSAAQVLVADDHPLSQEGLALAVRHALPDAQVTCVGTIAEALDAAMRRTDYRLAILDLMLPDTHGFSGLLRLQADLPSVPIAIITASHEPDLATIAHDLDAVAFLSKSMALDRLADALRTIFTGERVFPDRGPTMSRAALPERVGRLSEAQRRVLFALVDGRANKQIAYDLSISEATVKAHLTTIFRRLGVTNRMQAMLLLQPLFGKAAL